MATVVKTRIIEIGNSRGIRIPKLLLDQTDLEDAVELELQENQIVIRSAHRTRHDWADQFRRMAEKGDDALLDSDAPAATAWDEDEWEW